MSNIEGLKKYLNESVNAYYAIENIRNILNDNGFNEIEDCSDIKDGKYYIVRDNGGLIAFDIPEKIDRILMVASHSDSPCLHIKNNAEIFENGYLKLNVEPYGGMTRFTWFDRPLSICGRVIYKENNKFNVRLVNIDKDLMVIPSLCSHQTEYNRDGFNPNPQKEMLPVLKLSSEKLTFIEYLNEKTGLDVIDYDLYVYNRDKATLIGDNDEMLLSPRIDNLACAYGTLMGFMESGKCSNLKVYCCFNSEETGSLTADGADSTFLSDTLEIICRKKDVCLKKLLKKSFMISADNGHAIHPNYPEKSDPTNICYMNRGIMIKHHVNYTSSGLSSAILKDILKNANIPYQDFAARSDTRNGSTLGKISLNHVSVLSVDIGLSQLSMHSANETCGSRDIDYLIDGMKAYYQSEFEY